MIVQEGEQQAAEDKQTEAEQELVRAYVSIDKTATCRQVVLDGYLDRQETERLACEEGEEKCNVCRRVDSAEHDEEVEETSESSQDGSSNKEEMNRVKAERDKAERDEARQVFEQQQQKQRGPRQTIIQQRQQEFADIEWLRRQLA
jgi:hypothetical protein